MDQKLIGDIIQKAWDDASFKERLIKTPVQALEEELGVKIELPEGKILVVVDQSAENKIHINIPPVRKDEELTEDQLEAVAGGTNRSSFDLDGSKGPFIPIWPSPGPYNPYEDIIVTNL